MKGKVEMERKCLRPYVPTESTDEEAEAMLERRGGGERKIGRREENQWLIKFMY